MGEMASALGPEVMKMAQSQASGSGGGVNYGQKAEDERLGMLKKKYGLEDSVSLESFLGGGGPDSGYR